MKFADKEDKGYLSLEDVIRCINGNKIVDVWLVFVLSYQKVYKIWQYKYLVDQIQFKLESQAFYFISFW